MGAREMRKREVRRALAGLALAALAGCGSSWDPEQSRLDPGDLAFVVDPDRNPGAVAVPAYGAPDEHQPTSLAVNARVQVLSDQGPESEKQRLVLVVEKGEPGSERTLKIPRRFIHRYHLAESDTRPKPDPTRKAPAPFSKQSSWYPLSGSWQ
jgi:hypothetical protein